MRSVRSRISILVAACLLAVPLLPSQTVTPGKDNGDGHGVSVPSRTVQKLPDPPAKPSKKNPISPVGVWHWQTAGRNGEELDNTLTLTVDKKGNVSGKLIDRWGEHEVSNVTVDSTAGTATFDIPYHNRGIGDVPHTFTVNLDPDDPSVTIERPDPTPLARTKGPKRKEKAKAVHE
jgi:hypothetical protein